MRVILSEQLKRYRKLSNYTQEALADKCEVSRQAIAKWENGDSLPDVLKLSKLSKILGVPMEELLYGSADKKAVGISGVEANSKVHVEGDLIIKAITKE